MGKKNVVGAVDLDEGILCYFYREDDGKIWQQSLRRSKLIGRKVVCTNEQGQRTIGVIKGFDMETAAMVIETEVANFMPKVNDPKAVLILW